VTLALEVLSDYCCDLTRFNYFSNRIAKFSNQIANRISVFQIKSFHLKSNHQNGSNCDLNPNRDWDLPITVIIIIITMITVCIWQWKLKLLLF